MLEKTLKEGESIIVDQVNSAVGAGLRAGESRREIFLNTLANVSVPPLLFLTCVTFVPVYSLPFYFSLSHFVT